MSAPDQENEKMYSEKNTRSRSQEAEGPAQACHWPTVGPRWSLLLSAAQFPQG